MSTLAESSSWKDVISGAGDGVDGSYVEMIASTARESKWLLLTVMDLETTDELQIDVATGTGGSEVDILSDQFMSFTKGVNGMKSSAVLSIPMQIDSGTRVACRVKDDNGSAITHTMCLTLSDTATSATVPTSTESKQGLSLVTSGGSSGTFGSYVELFSSLAADIVWVTLMIYHPSAGSTPKAEFDIATGAGASEVVAIDGLGYRKRRAGGTQACADCYSFPVDFSSGTRLAIRVKDNVASTLSYDIGLIVFS